MSVALAPKVRRRILEVESRIPQQRAVWSSKAPYILMLGGRGASKSYTLIRWAFMRPPGHHVLVVAVRHKMLVYLAEELVATASRAGMVVPRGYKRQVGEIHLIDGKKIYLRSLDRPEEIQALSVDAVAASELGLYCAAADWSLLVSRCRRGSRHQLLIATSPPLSGKRSWLYDEFVTKALPGETEVHVVRSDENPYLPTGFVDRLRRNGESAEARSQLDAEWVDLGAV